MSFFRLMTITLTFFALCAQAKETYRFSVIRYEKSAQLLKGYEPLLEYLSRQTWLTFEFVHTESHDELIRKMENGEIDISHLGPQPYVMLKSRCAGARLAALFLDEGGNRQYSCALAVKEPSPITTLEQMSGMRLMSTQRLSTCGWLYPVGALIKAGIDPQSLNIRFAGTHVDAIMSLMLNEADAAAARADIVDRYRHLGIRRLATGGPYPNFVIVLNGKTVSPEHQKAIRSALLALKPEGADRRAGWHPYLRYGAAPALDSDFDPVRAELRAIGELE